MNISLTPELEQFVAEKVRSGRYASASEVVRDALRLLDERDELHQQRINEVKKKIAHGIAQLDAGEGITMDELKKRLAKRRAKQR